MQHLDTISKPTENTKKISLADQTGPGKVFPGSPWCEFCGKRIPAVVGMSPKGSINSEILAFAINKLDELNVYPRVPGGPIPFMLLDALDSCLQVPFLERVNRLINGRPAWKVCIGLPNETSI